MAGAVEEFFGASPSKHGGVIVYVLPSHHDERERSSVGDADEVREEEGQSGHSKLNSVKASEG